MRLIHKYFQISKINMANNLVYFWNFLSKNLFFVFIMFIYLMLWRNIYGSKGSTVAGFTLNQMIWYLVFTELVTLTRTDIHLQINDDVKSGNIAYLLNKPYNYVAYCFSYFIGELGIKLLTNGVIGILIGLIFVGPLQSFNLAFLPFIFLSLILGCIINFFIYTSIALLSFWFEDNNAFFWIYSKLIFTLGGMLMPIEFFPNWLKTISHFLPFPYVTYVPAKLAVSFSFYDFFRGFSVQLVYLVVFVLLSATMYGKGAKSLNVNGG
ncbi:ABC transporter permease [Clostridium manihotivorum]|uniref:ABC transporter permease n=1 Tax=Clostridium manihotivorum TaxID=2320868 RepID=A0A3R5QSX0_9CLOT|nr:ABC-2 family transporter protein [Clostridium manihotivorum]QAA31591.1 ABC transporter permease [Clostridium manihotivorum]